MTEHIIADAIRAQGAGFVFTARYFSCQADNVSVVTTALSRLVKKGVIRRLAHGLYDYPQVHNHLGYLMPSVARIVEAVQASDAIEVQPTGAYAANLLGISTQVPLRIEFLTNGPKKRIQVGNQEIVFRPTTPKNMVGAGTKAGLILHALRYLGNENVTPAVLVQIKGQLSESDFPDIAKQAQFAPAWITKHMKSLREGTL
jgi:hypothetical protein